MNISNTHMNPTASRAETVALIANTAVPCPTSIHGLDVLSDGFVLFRKRGELNATATGRLGEALGGIRIVKSYTAEVREERIFATNVDALFANVKKAVTAMARELAGFVWALHLGESKLLQPRMR